MSAGTLTLTNKSAAVSGSGTAFTTELAAGDFIVVTVGGIPYTLPVKTVNSNTSLTLVSNFTGPTQSGAAWSAVPRIAMNLVTAAVVTQAAEALRGLNYDKQNWQSIFSGTGNVTVKLPDGSSFTGPAWGGIVTILNGKAVAGANSDITSLSGLTTALSVKQGGTGAPNAATARTNLVVPGLATANTFTNPQTFSSSVFIDSSRYPSLTYKPNNENGQVPSNTEVASLMMEVAYTTAVGVSMSFIRRRLDGNMTGQIAITLPNTAGVLALQGTSGRDYKTDIHPADSAEALDRILSLELVNYVYKDDEQNRQRFGIIAEDAEKIAPQYIKHNQEPVPGTEVFDDEGNKTGEQYRDRPSIDNNPIVMDLLGSIQNLQAQITKLKDGMAALQK
ncbi:tail fiber domain-containing protein [Citrobacter braakii]|uniref:tail fiber domain-containing protein n=1 Tax=Citrobacter braakii TaxID=57706 RepID=UPI003D97DD41